MVSVVREFVGGGIGTKLHEEPQSPELGACEGARLREGTASAIEPMVNLASPELRVGRQMSSHCRRKRAAGAF